jgi:hypothetical protein
LALLAVLFVGGTLAAAAGFWRFKHYVETSPRFCQTCHEVAPEIAIWTESEHRSVRCQTCHHNSLNDGLHILAVYIRGEVPHREHAPIHVDSCVDCHTSHDPRWPDISSSIGHQVHAETLGLDCTGCHGQQMHFERPATEICIGCHQASADGSAHEAAHCLACHDFLSAVQVSPRRRACLDCHAVQKQPVVVSKTAPMRFECRACHRPHERRGLVPCDDCHRPEQLSGLHDHAAHQLCSACHEAHEWRSTRDQCQQCHAGLDEHHRDRACASCHSFGDD